MRRREFLASPAALALQNRRRPNVIVLISDDQGYGDLSLHGNPHLKTPHLDSIGTGGAQFTQFHVSPVCSPTRSSLMTGRWNYRTGVVDTYLGRSMMRPSEVTLPEMLRSAGYSTGISGKWHLGDNYPMRSVDKGFQDSLVCKGGGLAQPAGPPGDGYFNPVLEEQGKSVRKQGYCTDIFFDHALGFIEKHRRDPFFLYIAANAPHDPLEIDDKWVAPFQGKGLEERTAKVYGMVANLDFNTGRLLERLRKLDLEKDTLLIYMTDNGPQHARFNGGMRGRKGTVYQGGIRVPSFWRWPGHIRPGLLVDRIGAHVDIAPTILDVCGVDPPRDRKLDGRSLKPLWEQKAGAQASWQDRHLFFQWHRGDVPEFGKACAVRNQRHKLVNLSELYDLEKDPAEAVDLASSQPEQVKALRQQYEAWFRDVGSQGYDPPRIHLGSQTEPRSVLTRQDWRGPQAGWAPESLGYWEVFVERAAPYQIRLEFPAAPANGTAEFKLGSATASAPVQKGATEVSFRSVSLPAGAGRLEPALRLGDQTIGVHYVNVAV